MENKNLEDLLFNAIKMEQNGYKFYAEAGKKAGTDVAKKTFEFLAENELLHIESIRKFYDTLKEKGEFPALTFDNVEGGRMKDLTIFSENISSLRDKVRPSDDDKKALEFAMDFENSGYKYYEKMLEDVKDEKLVKFLKFLLAEESRHFDIIQKTHSYITDSDNWFMYEEDSFPQGG